MPHRGSLEFLHTALDFLLKSDAANLLDLRIGIDSDEPTELRSMYTVARDRAISFSRVLPAPAGPYVIRQHLIEQCNSAYIAFHDSDDVSTEDRVVRQSYELEYSGADLVGCHELRLNEIDHQVEAIRFPLDVSGALDAQGSAESTFLGEEPLLHATAIVVRSRFIAAGGFATDQKIANDTQFMLRAYFSLKLRNVDEFLYVRRTHRKALTTTPETALGTPLRRLLAASWKRDFDAVKAGRLKLSESSLMPRRGNQNHVFLALDAEK